VVDIPDTGTMFGSAVRCEMVMGYKVDNSKRRNEDPHAKRAVSAINHPGKRSRKERANERGAELRLIVLRLSPRIYSRAMT
jgi:hypothetical protein